jgi:hypothetical protein
MLNGNNRNSLRIVGACFVCLILFCAGCYARYAKSPQEKPPLPEIKKVVVVGFRPALSPGDEPGVIRSPVSGAVFFGEPVPQHVADNLTTRLFNKLLKDKGYDLISPGQAKGVFSSLLSSDSVLGDTEIAQKIGQAFSADAVLVGYAFRWRDRQGTDYAVDLPASVAFGLYLISAQNGGVLWKGRFDKTQQSLSENLLDMETFLIGKGRWMKAQEMADHGLDGLLKNLPKGKTE